MVCGPLHSHRACWDANLGRELLDTEWEWVLAYSSSAKTVNDELNHRDEGAEKRDRGFHQRQKKGDQEECTRMEEEVLDRKREDSLKAEEADLPDTWKEESELE
ncbi:hypothetical protein NDU88_010085 [Pleurodeles waltl]|uniref:Uncharacterized protein n=1 Tax=Pleurodeles waltl TaxID=8319 RepID=A0AAV7S094_PLEWA|nr:hypothetical protein NDU88_010085 [Pleurodeles waltl]